MTHIGGTEHANEDEAVGVEDALHSNVTKCWQQFRGDIRQEFPCRGQVRLAKVANSHGNGGVNHANGTEQTERSQAAQILEKAEREQSGARNAEETGGSRDGKPSSCEQTLEGIGKNHGVGQRGTACLECTTSGRDPIAILANTLGPGFTVALGTGVSAYASNERKAIAADHTNGSNEADGRDQTGRGITETSDASRKGQDPSTDNFLVEKEGSVMKCVRTCC